MKQFSAQLKKKSESLRLTTAEREALRERVTAYMAYHPLPKELAAAKRAPALEVEPFIVVPFRSWYIRGALTFGALLFVVSVPLAAERAVPGDVLYPVKVQFNEELRGSFAGSGYETIEWETERLSRRIAEARVLAAEGRLTNEVEAEVAAAVKTHSDAAREAIDTLRETDAEEAAIAEITLASALDVQTAVLAATPASTTLFAIAASDPIALAVADAKSAVSEQPGTPSFARLSARVELETTRAAEYFASIEDRAAELEIKEIGRRLEDIARKFTKAREALVDDEVAAVDLLRDTLSNTQKLIAFMTDIDVRTSVAIEDLVPTELTDDERLALVASSTDRLAEVSERLAAVDVALLVPDVAEKFIAGLAQLETLTDQLATVESGADLVATETATANALMLALDLEQMLLWAGGVTDNGTGTSTDALPDAGVGSSTATSSATTTDDVIDPAAPTDVATGTDTTATDDSGTSTEPEV